MKFILSIFLNLVVLLVFTATPTSFAWACGANKHKKETCCKEKCKKDCCKNKHTKHPKGKCNDDCNGNCSCTATYFSFAVLEQTAFDLSFPLIDFIGKQTVFYKEVFPKSIFLEFWQPPKL